MRFDSRNGGALQRLCVALGPRTALLVLCVGTIMPATAAQLRLLQVREAQVRTSVVAQSAQPSGEDAASTRVVVQVGNDQHVLMLRVNSSLGAWASRQQPGAVAFEGYLPNLPGSWVRVTRIGTRWAGIWFDGAGYYGIDTAGAVASANDQAAAAAADSLVVFKLADAVLDGTAFGNDMVRPTLNGQELAEMVSAQLQAPATAAAVTATHKLSVGVLADTQLAALDGAATTSNMLARINVVDGIFSSQVGVRIEAKSTTLLDAAALSYTGTDPSQLLTSLKDYRGGNATQLASGLTHLMTGRNLDGTTVGIAYLSDASKGSIALCNSGFSASLSEARTSVGFDALIAAHEMGHVFGAPHDGETDPAANQACATTLPPPTYLMAGTISGSQTFSSCSLDQIAPVVAIAKTRSQCLVLIDADLSLAAAGDATSVVVGSDIGVTLTVRNLGNVNVADAQLNITLPAGLTLGAVTASGISCALAGAAVNCSPSPLAANATATVRLTLRGAVAGAANLTASIASSVSDSVASNNQTQLAITVNAAAPPPASGGSNSGGGGAAGVELLLALLLLAQRLWARRDQPDAVAKNRLR